MRTFLLLTAAWLGVALTAHEQLTLQPGDSYTFSFSALPESSVGYFGYAPSGGLWFHVSDFEAGVDQLSFYIFEDSPEHLSVAGGVTEAVQDGTAFPDANGGVVFTMLAGSVTLEDMTFFYQEPVDEINSRRYTLTLVPDPVPEPHAGLLLVIGAAIATMRRK